VCARARAHTQSTNQLRSDALDWTIHMYYLNNLCLLLLILQLKGEAQEKGFVIKILSERSCHRLLMFILEVFQELSLEVLRVANSCVDNFWVALDLVFTRSTLVLWVFTISECFSLQVGWGSSWCVANFFVCVSPVLCCRWAACSLGLPMDVVLWQGTKVEAA